MKGKLFNKCMCLETYMIWLEFVFLIDGIEEYFRGGSYIDSCFSTI